MPRQEHPSPQTFAAEQREREISAMAFYGALFAHWRDCRLAQCRRVRGCRGEVVPCFRRWWRGLSEERKEEGRERMRAIIAAAGDGA